MIKTISLITLSLLAFVSSSREFHYQPIPTYSSKEVLTIYEAACLGTCVDPALLRAVAICESDECDSAIGPDNLDEGRFQLRRLYHAERAAKWGAFDPFDPQEAARIAALILDGYYRMFGNWPGAVAAYNAGLTGARLGRGKKYSKKVMQIMLIMLYGHFR